MIYIFIISYLLGILFSLYITLKFFEEITISYLIISLISSGLLGIIILILNIQDIVIYKRK